MPRICCAFCLRFLRVSSTADNVKNYLSWGRGPSDSSWLRWSWLGWSQLRPLALKRTWAAPLRAADVMVWLSEAWAMLGRMHRLGERASSERLGGVPEWFLLTALALIHCLSVKGLGAEKRRQRFKGKC